MSKFLLRAFLAFFVLAVGLTPAMAQQKDPRALGTFKDWLAYSWVENGHKVCYMLSRPTKSLPTNVNRGDIYLMVTYRPQSKSKEEVSHVTGYPYKSNSTAEVVIGNHKFTLATDKDVAWVPENMSDETLIKAMKRGAKLVIRGRSQRGTLTTDTYSLEGFTAAHRQIRKSCT